MRNPLLCRLTTETLLYRSAQERAPHDKYKSSWWRFKLEASFHKNSFGISGAKKEAQNTEGIVVDRILQLESLPARPVLVPIESLES